MIKLLRSTIVSAAFGWAWKNKSSIQARITSLRSDTPPDNPPEGYARAAADGASS